MALRTGMRLVSGVVGVAVVATLVGCTVVERDGGEIVTGTPVVTGARVVGIVEGEARGPKIRVFKKKRRKGMRRTKGHRSTFTLVRITEIQA